MPRKSNRAVWIILGGIVVLAVFLWIGVVNWFSNAIDSGDEWMSEGREFGVAVNNDGCVAHALELDEACWGMTCKVRTPIFLYGCLQTSQPIMGFCDEVPSRDRAGATITWRIRRCADVEGAGQNCPEVFGAVQRYCASK